jgi:hypothetical protein
MKIQEALKFRGFIENVDYRIEGNAIIALPKTRQVEQVIPHAEIVAVKGQEGHGIIPAEFDSHGVEISPMKPAQEFIAEVVGVPAHNEVILVTETYYESIPSMAEMELESIDVALAVGEYLADKADLRDVENDSINIVNNKIHSFNFKNIPQPTPEQLLAAYKIAEAKQVSAEEKAAAKKYLADTDYLIIRELDAGTPCSAEIKAARAAARLKAV